MKYRKLKILVVLLLCVLFSCDPKTYDNSDCPDAGTTRCNESTKIEIVDPYCQWEVIADCSELDMICCSLDGIVTCCEVL